MLPLALRYNILETGTQTLDATLQRVVDKVLNTPIVDGTYSLADIAKLAAAIAAGKTTKTDAGGGNETVVFRNIADNKDVITANVLDSERTTVTLNLA